jgi:2-haloacid dehalogenase
VKKRYSWLWFDADGTLFDYEQAERIALQRAFRSLGAAFDDAALETYRRINQQVWQALERGEIAPGDLPVRRFELLREVLQLVCSPQELSQAYLGQLSQRAELLDGAGEVLAALRPKYRFAIVTNGLRAVQRSRLLLSPIRDYISAIVISEEVGAAKPEAGFFAAALAQSGNPEKTDVLVIGDSLSSDILGGVRYGLDTCWYNPAGAPRPADLPITHEITRLRELLDLLG